MTEAEFSNEFDILFNNITSNLAPGLDDWEKSIFLTTALELVVLSSYNGRNVIGESFESTEELRRYLDSLIITDNLVLEEKVTPILRGGKYHISYSLPSTLWFIVYEEATITSDNNRCNENKIVDVFPVTHDSYTRISRNPFRGPNDNRVLRLDTGKNIVELVSNYPITKYTISYICKPSPIILEDNLDPINGVTKKQTCLLNPAIHRTILLLAVKLAKEAWSTSTGN